MRRCTSSSSSISSSADLKKSSAAPKGAALARRKKPVKARSPLQDLNGVVSRTYGANASSSSSASTSIEAPRGCLRFFLSNPSSCARPKAPFSDRSRPVLPENPKPTNAPKPKKNPNPPKCSGKSMTLSISGNSEAEFLKKKQDYELPELHLCSDIAENRTPVSKLPSGSGLLGLQSRGDDNNDDANNKTRTPPIEPSVSPEIQCGGGLNVLSTATKASGRTSMQPCYAAGHVLSGIADKRKCKPRGILTLRDNNSDYNKFENSDSIISGDDGIDVPVNGKRHGLSPIPLPCEGSIQWLSPCNEKDEKDRRLKGSVLASLAASSPMSLSSSGFSSDVFSKCSLISSTNDSSNGNSRRRGLLDFQGFEGPKHEVPSPSHITPMISNSTSKKDPKCHYYDEKESNAFSNGSFGSGNVMQTPNSGPADLSFHLAQVQKDVDSKPASWVSNSTSEFVPWQDPLRISWRDGLVSRIFEVDEFDCCRCFSDQEEEEDSKNLELHHNPPPPPEKRGEIRDNANVTKQMDSQIQSMSLDSMSCNGDSLVVSSDDSSWNLCYKNSLFNV